MTGTAGRRRALSLNLQQLGLSALDAVYLVADDPTDASPALQTLAAGATGIGGPSTVDAGDAPPAGRRPAL